MLSFQRLYAKAGYYYITVEASDKGAERRATTQRFVIDVYDVNDAFPIFVQPDPDNAVVQILEVPCTQSDTMQMMMMMMMMMMVIMMMMMMMMITIIKLLLFSVMLLFDQAQVFDCVALCSGQALVFVCVSLCLGQPQCLCVTLFRTNP